MKTELKQIEETITEQFNTMLGRGMMPCFEFELPGEEYLLVNISLHGKGVAFSFDTDGKQVWFDGDIIELATGSYVMPYDECFEHLDTYLQAISENISEGYLMPNDLFV